MPSGDWPTKYDRGWLRGDLIAGIAVTTLIVPKNRSYAGIAPDRSAHRTKKKKKTKKSEE